MEQYIPYPLTCDLFSRNTEINTYYFVYKVFARKYISLKVEENHVPRRNCYCQVRIISVVNMYVCSISITENT